jgi:hypothetical protein
VEGPDGRRFALGHAGDWFVVGDWDCDGLTSPALYRPATGDVFLFDRWANDVPLSSRHPEHRGIIGGRPVVESGGGCDRVVIEAGTP